MGRNRVLSFMSQLSSHSPVSSNRRNSYAAPATSSVPIDAYNKSEFHHTNFDSPYPPVHAHQRPSTPEHSSPAPGDHDSSPVVGSPFSISGHRRTRSRSSSRPLSMVQSYQPPLMDVSEDTIPELQPIFTFLNSHANKLYQEGYFLKLDDQNSQGKPNPDRTWTECFAQLVGTVLSLWDAAELDAAGDEGEVLPKFINLTDASIKMIESLPTRSNEEQPLQNILSISTAGRNRYLLHFNSKHSLIQWTAGIRLAIFEHSTLQEAYTGALIAGKGKRLNNIGVIMERSRVKVEEWVRVRFGAGVPWRRCWCVISPPDEKEYQKLQKELKKRSPYDRSHPPILKGDIKFYDTRVGGKRHKKARPIATITEAYSAYALYPQAKSLIDASTLVKIEGNITIHSDPPSSTEGFVFIMPEVHPAVSGFEMMLRYLFPTWDTFGLYGRPGRLVASVLDSRSLMFALPKHRRYGYLEILDVTGLILSDGSSSWSEREWRKRLKELTGTRMSAMDDSGASLHSRSNSRSSKRLSFGPSPLAVASRPSRVGLADGNTPANRSSRSLSLTHRLPPRTDSAPPAAERDFAPSPMAGTRGHNRNASDSHLAGAPTAPPPPPNHVDNSVSDAPRPEPAPARHMLNERWSSEDERSGTPVRELEGQRNLATPEPVSQPPAFGHAPGSKPDKRPYQSPELRRTHSRMSSTTLAQLAKAGNVAIGEDVWQDDGRTGEEQGGQATGSTQQDQRGPADSVHPYVNHAGVTAANAGSREALSQNQYPSSSVPPSQMGLAPMSSKSLLNQSPGMPGQHRDGLSSNARSGTTDIQPPGYPPGNGPNNRSMLSPGRGPPSNSSFQDRGYPTNLPPPNRGPSPNTHGGFPQGSAGRGRGVPPGMRPPHYSTNMPSRKPLPARTDSLQNRRRPEEPLRSPTGSSGGFTGGLDSSALAQVHTQDSLASTTSQIEPQIRRQDTTNSGSSSYYDDAVSSISPDYASSSSNRPSMESVERPRAGVLRTTGQGREDKVPISGPGVGILDIDFGPTLNYAQTPHTKNPPPPITVPSARPYSPARAHSPVPPPPSKSPVPPPPPPKSPGPGVDHQRNGSNDSARRSVAWQPAAATIGPSGPGAHAISAEEFVKQRAQQATPLYAHQRQPSGNTLGGMRTNTPTPPPHHGPPLDYFGAAAHSRNGSQEKFHRPSSRGPGDLLQRPSSLGPGDLLQRPSSRGPGDLLQRPSSRGAGAVLGGQGGSGESHLSAREQEYVSRTTGTPLINMAGSRTDSPASAGLVGAIEAREREKQMMRQGYGSQATQQAIHQRQQQTSYPYQQPMGSPGFPPPAGMYSNMSGRNMMGSPHQSSPFASPGAQPSPQGGWAAPGGFNQQGNFDPRYMPQQGPGMHPQGQLGPQYPPVQSPSPGQQTQGRGQPMYPYQGPAF